MSVQTASSPMEDQVEILEYNFNKVNKHPDPTTLYLIAAELCDLGKPPSSAATDSKGQKSK